MEGINNLRSGEIMGLSADFGGASHIVDCAIWLMGGEPIWVQSTMMGRPSHTLGIHIGMSGGGVIALTHYTSQEPGIEGRWRVVGGDWEARVTGGYVPPTGGWKVGPASVLKGGNWEEIAAPTEPMEGEPEPWFLANAKNAAALIAKVNDEVDSRYNLASFKDGAIVQCVFDAAMESERSGRRVQL